MGVQDWLATFGEVIEGTGCRLAEAGAVAEYLERFAANAGTLVEARRRDGQELLIVDLRTGAPQRPFYPVLPVERIGIFFANERSAPFVVMLRDDFPDTEHQHLVPEGCPASICIDDRPWSEAKLTWTPAELIERILSWFHRAARGELHDARQPLDPFMLISSLGVIVERSILQEPSSNLIASIEAGDTMLLVTRAAGQGVGGNREPFCIVAYSVAPGRMRRLRHAPTNLGGLADMLQERGIDLIGDLTATMNGWFAEGAAAGWRLNSRFAVLVELPVVAPDGQVQQGSDHRGFITPQTAGDIAVALGIAERAPSGIGKVGYARLIGQTEANRGALAAIVVQAAEVHLAFDADLAARLVGRLAADDRKAVIVGAGAIGSHVADNVAREGRFTWTAVDDDRLLPHNLARHTARAGDVTKLKATILAEQINAIFGAQRARAIPANVVTPETHVAQVDEALREADVIIDTTASLVAARHLSDRPDRGRRASLFFNPSGEAGVLLAEPAGRALTLRDLEAQYLGLLLRSPHLAEHLGKQGETVAYTGACRAVTNRISQSHAAVLSGLTARALCQSLDRPEGVVGVWTLAPSGDVTADIVQPEPVLRFAVHGWEITIDKGLIRRIYEMREQRVPAETGGVLFGLVDIPAKMIHLVAASPAPLDSKEEPGGFVRGVVGIEDLMADVRRKAAGQVRYVGEWHSHPPRASARPSTVDGQQIDWLAALMGMESMPALMFIAAEREFCVVFADERSESIPTQQAAA